MKLITIYFISRVMICELKNQFPLCYRFFEVAAGNNFHYEIVTNNTRACQDALKAVIILSQA
jgi:hypothetical protein